MQGKTGAPETGEADCQPDPWLKVLKLAAEEYLEWHQFFYAGTVWWHHSAAPWRVREIMRDRAISAFRYAEVYALCDEPIKTRRVAEEIAWRLKA